jgi:hypothetical protein
MFLQEEMGFTLSVSIYSYYYGTLCCWKAGMAQSALRMRYEPEYQGSIPGRYAKLFSLCHRVHTDSGTHQDSYPMGKKGILSPAVNRPGREADHSPPFSAEVTSSWHGA